MPNQTNPTTQKIIANYIGSIAQQSLANEQIVIVMGNTSLGIFLKTAPKWVVFLSYEDFRGPLTVNLVGDVSPLRELPIRGRLHISRDGIAGPGTGVSIELEDALPWMPPPPPQSLNGGEHKQRLLTFLQQAYMQAGGVGLSALLPFLMEDSVYVGNHPQQEELVTMQENLERGNIFNLIQTLGNLLGRGRGLTPSWDDFTMGFLLTLNRWEHIIQPHFDLGKLNAEITKAAYAKTESAKTAGQGDGAKGAGYFMMGFKDQKTIDMIGSKLCSEQYVNMDPRWQERYAKCDATADCDAWTACAAPALGDPLPIPK